MKGLNKFSDDYFLKYKEKRVRMKPYDPHQQEIADLYIQKIDELLKSFEVELMVRGSTAFKIMGKGEVEVGVYPKEMDWQSIIEKLEEEFGPPENIEDDYVRFNDEFEDIEVEIILLRGYEAEADQKLHKFLISKPELLKEYVDIKKKYCFSKREYQKQKSKFLDRVIKEIPD